MRHDTDIMPGLPRTGRADLAALLGQAYATNTDLHAQFPAREASPGRSPKVSGDVTPQGDL